MRTFDEMLADLNYAREDWRCDPTDFTARNYLLEIIGILNETFIGEDAYYVAMQEIRTICEKGLRP
jgi:hypothetical protein